MIQAQIISHTQKNKKTIECDIGDLKKLSNILKDNNIKTVIHAAASYINESELKKKFYYNNNVIKTKKFISLITKKNKKIYFFFQPLMSIKKIII